jgi:hypothetical protein
MKEVEVIIGIILIVIGAILFEMGQSYVEESMNWGNTIKLSGFILLSAGVIICVFVVDFIGEKKKRLKRRI